MSNASRKQRGHETQNAVAAYFRDHGWPHAESAGAGRQGVDVLGLAGISCEVKARRQLALPAWLRQAATSPGLPVVVHRPDGMGPATIDDWPATMRLADLTRYSERRATSDRAHDRHHADRGYPRRARLAAAMRILRARAPPSHASRSVDRLAHRAPPCDLQLFLEATGHSPVRAVLGPPLPGQGSDAVRPGLPIQGFSSRHRAPRRARMRKRQDRTYPYIYAGYDPDDDLPHGRWVPDHRGILRWHPATTTVKDARR